MRGRTRNFLENVGAFVFLIILLIIIFLVIANYTSLGKALELDAIKESILKNFEDSNDKNETIKDDKTIILQKENNQSTISSEKIKKEEVTKVNNKEENNKNLVEKTEEKKVELPKFPVKIKEETAKVENKVQEVKKQEPKEQKETSSEQTPPSEQKKSGPVLSAKNLAKFSIINKFIKDTKTKINNNIKKQNILKVENPRYANIRVTVLKDGGYEQLILMDGDKEYFNLIKEGVLSSFPLSIDPKINDQFPRYFRMKVIEGR